MKLHSFNPSRTLAYCSVAVVALLTLAGCSNDSISEIEDLETVSLFSQTDQLAQTMEYIRSIERYEQNNFRDKVNSGLNRWISGLDEAAAPQWKLPALTAGLPDELKTELVFTHIDDDSFFSNDANYVQQVFWFHEIANRVVKSNFIYNQEYMFRFAIEETDQKTLDELQQSEDLLLDAIKLLQPELVTGEGDSLDQSRAIKLAQAIKLFDWTVRNVQLQVDLPWPDQETIKTQALVEEVDPEAWPANTGTPGPGYVHFPWQILTYGRGDSLERAQIFASLCHQVNIPVAVLAFENEPNSRRPYDEWLCAVAIGDEMYLFDPMLGMPIHGEREATIATLSEVQKSPELLSRLDLSVDESVEKLAYPVKSEMLDRLIALVVAPPESVSKRMKAVEENLSGDNRMNLTVDADDLASQFEKFDGINKSVIWHVPFSNQVFRDRFSAALITASYDQDIRGLVSELANQETYIDQFVMLRTARNCFLRGIFQSDLHNGIRSAISYYYGFMYTDEEISEVDVDPTLQESLGILKGADQDFKDWENQLLFLKSNMTRVRIDASFFLAMCHYENGFPATALKWFERIREGDNEMTWTPYLRYHSGRAHEAAGDYGAAARSYGADNSPQKYGSLLRKRWMTRLQEKDGS